VKAFIVVDLGFGDAGKGLMTDYLVRRHQAGLVVRFNGGAQAGHNVVEAGGRQHTFSQLGSGTFVRGVATHLARPVVVHPTALRVELERLATIGETDALSRLSIDPRCRVTTPFHQALGRLRELVRRGGRHGSCGVGFGETVGDSLTVPELTLELGELLHPERARARLTAQRHHKLRQARELVERLEAPPDEHIRRELELLSSETVEQRWLSLASDVARSVRLVRDEALSLGSCCVFEGAQGVLLDENYGFHPFTTWSRCTPHGARELLSQIGWSGDVETVGVLRSYTVRHGPGPFPTEDPLVAERTPEPHNALGAWQGPVRKGWLDLVLLHYALAGCNGIDALALTHLDALSALKELRYCESYRNQARLQLPQSLAEQEKLTRLLSEAEPLYTSLTDVTPADASAALSELAGVAVKYGSVGPTAGAVFERR
jgi:adenylosuccinate synthase